MYFDRVHPNIPIFNQARYFARTRGRETTSPSALSLQYAMWTMAMAHSSQFEGLHPLLYREVRRMLEAFELAGDGTESDSFSTSILPVPIEHIQVWLLVAFYELARVGHHRASVSAGRAFRLIQLARLHEMDSNGEGLEDSEDDVAMEERRRTFWVAYCLDRSIALRNGCPLTLTEELVRHPWESNISTLKYRSDL